MDAKPALLGVALANMDRDPNSPEMKEERRLQKLKKRKLDRQAKLEGKCSKCESRPADPGFKTCLVCREKNRSYQRRYKVGKS